MGMTELEIIRALDKMICSKEELLRYVENSTIREEVDALKELRTGYCSVLDLETEYKLLQKKYRHRCYEVNNLRHVCDKLHAELEEAKNPKRCYEVLFTDGSSTRVENAASWTVSNETTRIRDVDGRTVAMFMTDEVRGIIKRGEWEDDED